jgi:uncharacterized protein (AIM24 family)
MAQFEVVESEGMHWVKINLRDESVRAEAGALSYMNGDIVVDVPLPSVRGAMASVFADESFIRPTYSGTGEINLEGVLGGFHVVDLNNESWILESGAYWASDGSIDVSIFRERVSTAFWTGEGFVQFRTKVRGTGKVIVRTDGPLEEIELNSGRYLAEGKIVIGRTGDITYTLQRPTRTFLGYLMAGESYLRCYEGSGRLLVCSTPYWRVQFQKAMRHP